VAVGAVADVVEECGGLDGFGARPVDVEVPARALREVVDAKRVLEARVVRARVDETHGRELFDVPQSLERLRVQEVRGDAIDLDVVVDAVLDRSHWTNRRRARAKRPRLAEAECDWRVTPFDARARV